MVSGDQLEWPSFEPKNSIRQHSLVSLRKREDARASLTVIVNFVLDNQWFDEMSGQRTVE